LQAGSNAAGRFCIDRDLQNAAAAIAGDDTLLRK
jgi:hypothetical protein